MTDLSKRVFQVDELTGKLMKDFIAASFAGEDETLGAIREVLIFIVTWWTPIRP